ncbi:uncharacterized protein TNCV_3195211 [Trichonephila clavipes]|uniref:Transposase n=1 Tax=Trichonephila clavipes TaxID=2585209 RepID=A0A8X6UWR5_TRICX|nr:uncharacterized protein TNCV_3195211 [Trichonephila clavipes]
MISKFEATGCLDDRPRSGRPSTRRNAAKTVKDEMETVAGSSMHGEVSAHAVARRTGIPYTTVWLALRRTLRCYPYKIHRHHELLPGDSVNRRAFAVWTFQKMAEDDDWLSNLLWTDETHFTLRGSVNTHNCRIWATENPRTVVKTPLHDEKVTVWVGFTTSTIIGPFFFEEMRDSGFATATVTGERYADMLQNRIIPSLADKHLLERTIFMQDGASPHIARRVKDLLRRSFGDDRVLSRHFHHAWPPRSSDLSPELKTSQRPPIFVWESIQGWTIRCLCSKASQPLSSIILPTITGFKVHPMRGDKDQWLISNPGYVQTEMILRHMRPIRS